MMPASTVPAAGPTRGFAALYVTTLETLAIAAIAAMTLVAGLQVFYRYVLADSLFWSEELMRYLMVWTAYLCAGLAYSRGEMLGMRMVVDACPLPLRTAIDWVGRGLVTVLLLVIVWSGVEFALRTRHEEATALRVSMLWIHASVPIGAALLAVHVIFSGFFRGVVAPSPRS